MSPYSTPINPVFVPAGVSASLRQFASAEHLALLESILALSHHLGSAIGADVIMNAIAHTPGTLAKTAIAMLPANIRASFAVMASRAVAVANGNIAPARSLIITLGGRYCDFSFIERDKLKNSTDLLDDLMPKPDETWPVGVDLTLDECAKVSTLAQEVSSYASAPAPSTRIIIVPGPNRVHAFRLEDAGAFMLATKDGSQPMVVGQLISAQTGPQLATMLEFEALVNAHDATESDFQSFFERHPYFLFGDELCDWRSNLTLTPRVQLTGSDVATLRPDFFVRRPGAPLWDILELKLPNAALLRRSNRQRGFAQSVRSAVDQLRAYYDFFADPANREWFAAKHGVDVYYPNLSLVIGRAAQFRDWQERRRLERELNVSGAPVRLVTYDDLIRVARSREFFIGRVAEWPLQ